MPQETPSAQDLTRQLISRETGETAGTAETDAPDAAVAAVHAACERAHGAVARWLGANGSHALFTRALAVARAGSSGLGRIRLRPRPASGLEGVPESIHAHGAASVAAGLEALLTALIELLGRLIGHDMAVRLLDQTVQAYAHNNKSQNEQNRDYESQNDDSLERRSATP